MRAAALVPAVTLAACVFASSAAAGTLEFRSSADTYVGQAAPRQTHGTARRIWTSGDIPVDQTLVRFSVSGLAGDVTGATLRLYAANGTSNGPAVFRTSGSWSEKATSWMNRPGRTSGPRDDKGALRARRWVEWDVTPWVTGNGTYNFVLRGGRGSPARLSSREATRGPRLVITTADEAPPPPPTPSGEPAPVAGLGYHEVFRDDFDTLDRHVWDDHIWYDDPPRSSWVGYQSAEDGVLHLRTSRDWHWGSGSSDSWPINTITTQSSGLTFTQGYFEARMRWTGARGAWPGFWLFSYRHSTNDFWPSVNPFCAHTGLPKALCYSGELDVFEGQGAEPRAFYGTIHRNSSNDYGVGDDQNDNNYQEQSFELAADWHTYGMLWTPSQITWYLDGRPLMSAPTYDSTNQPMYLLLQMWTGGWSGDPNASTPDVLETQVDYVDVWQK